MALAQNSEQFNHQSQANWSEGSQFRYATPPTHHLNVPLQLARHRKPLPASVALEGPQFVMNPFNVAFVVTRKLELLVALTALKTVLLRALPRIICVLRYPFLRFPHETLPAHFAYVRLWSGKMGQGCDGGGVEDGGNQEGLHG